MEISNHDASGALTIRGALDISTAGALRDALQDGLEHQPDLALDLSEVDACDTAALQVLLAAHKSAARDKKHFTMTAVSAAVTDAANTLGISTRELTGELAAEGESGRGI